MLPALLQPHWPSPAYWVAARLALEGRVGPLYADDPVFIRAALDMGTVPDIFAANAPTTLLPFLPTGGLSETSAHQFWLLLGIGALVIGWIALLAALRVDLTAGVGLTAILPLFHPIRENIARGQVYSVVFAAIVVGAVLATRAAARSAGGSSRATAAWTALAGIALAAAGVLKLFYGLALLVPGMIGAGKGRRVALGGAALLGLSALLTMILWGLDPWLGWLRSSASWRARPEIGITAYQTLSSVISHLLRFDATWNCGPVADLPGLVDPIWYGMSLVLGIVGLAAARRAATSTSADPRWQLLPFAAVVPLALALSPEAEDYHFVLALFPLVVAGAVTVRPPWPRRPREWAGLVVLVAAAVLLAAPWPYNVPGVEGWGSLLYYPRLWGAVLLFGLLVVHALTGSSSDVGERQD